MNYKTSQNHTRNLLRHSLIYGTGEILTRITGFILIPIYTRFLLPDSYGILQLLLVTSSLITIVFQFGIGSAIFKSILYNKDIQVNTVYSTAFIFLTLSSLTITIVLIQFSNDVSILLLESFEYSNILKILLASVFLKNISVIPLAKLRIEEKSWFYTILTVTRFLLQVLLNIYFVVSLRAGINGIIYAEFITSAVFSVIYIIIISKNIVRHFSVEYLKDMLEFGLPLMPASIAMFVLTMANRYFIKHFGTLEDVGLYSLSYRFGIIMSLIVGSFQRAWATSMFSIAKEKNAYEIFSKNFTYFISFLTFIGLIISLFSKEAVMLMSTQKYFESYQVVPFLAFSYLCYGIYFYGSCGLNIKKKTIYQPVIVIVSSLICLLLNFILIPRYGNIGAGISNSVSFLIMALMLLVISNHFYPIQYDYKKVLIILLMGILFTVVGLNTGVDNVVYAILIKVILIGFFPIIMNIFHVIKLPEMFKEFKKFAR